VFTLHPIFLFATLRQCEVRNSSNGLSYSETIVFRKTAFIIPAFSTVRKTFFNFYSHSFATSALVLSFSACFSHFQIVFLHFKGFIRFFPRERVDFLHDYAGFCF